MMGARGGTGGGVWWPLTKTGLAAICHAPGAMLACEVTMRGGSPYRYWRFCKEFRLRLGLSERTLRVSDPAGLFDAYFSSKLGFRRTFR
jgi:hypothetical protein